MDHFVDGLVAQPALDLARLRTPDALQLAGVEVHQTAGELLPARLVHDRHHVSRREGALHIDQARGQETPSLLS
jgi:hypothetical protein